MLRLTQVARAFRTLRACRTFQSSTIRKLAIEPINHAQDLRTIVNNVNETYKDKWLKDMCYEVKKRINEADYLKELAHEGYTDHEIFDQDEMLDLFPQSKTDQIYLEEYVRQFIATNPELYGFKLYLIKHKFRVGNKTDKYVGVGIRW